MDVRHPADVHVHHQSVSGSLFTLSDSNLVLRARTVTRSKGAQWCTLAHRSSMPCVASSIEYKIGQHVVTSPLLIFRLTDTMHMAQHSQTIDSMLSLPQVAVPRSREVHGEQQDSARSAASVDSASSARPSCGRSCCGSHRSSCSSHTHRG